MGFISLLDPVFAPLLALGPLAAIAIICFILSVIITVAYKYMTDQELMKTLKADIKGFQKQMKEFKDNPEKMMAIQKDAMEKNLQYMMHSMKPTMITFIPIILIFGWLNANLAFLPIIPGAEFTTTITFANGAIGPVELLSQDGIKIVSDPVQDIMNNQARWTLKGDEGDYILQYKIGDRMYEKDLKISSERYYATPLKKVKDDMVKQISIDNEKMKPLSIFGWKLGWLGTYIIFSIIFSMVLRKLLKLH